MIFMLCRCWMIEKEREWLPSKPTMLSKPIKILFPLPTAHLRLFQKPRADFHHVAPNIGGWTLPRRTSSYPILQECIIQIFFRDYVLRDATTHQGHPQVSCEQSTIEGICVLDALAIIFTRFTDVGQWGQVEFLLVSNAGPNKVNYEWVILWMISMGRNNKFIQ